jgi:hypothetical protein
VKLDLLFHSYDIMHKCWQLNSSDRPTFGDLVRDIEEFLTELMNYFDPNACDEPLPPDPYMNWTQQFQAQAMEVEEQQAQEQRDLEMLSSNQLAHQPEDIIGNGADVIVNVNVDRERSPRYHGSTHNLDVDEEKEPRYHDSTMSLDVGHSKEQRKHPSTGNLVVDVENEPRYHGSTLSLDLDHQGSPRYHDSRNDTRFPYLEGRAFKRPHLGSADNVGSTRYHDMEI